jgi:hypothetical protein
MHFLYTMTSGTAVTWRQTIPLAVLREPARWPLLKIHGFAGAAFARWAVEYTVTIVGRARFDTLEMLRPGEAWKAVFPSLR